MLLVTLAILTGDGHSSSGFALAASKDKADLAQQGPEVSSSESILNRLISEALARSPLLIASRHRWLALTKVPVQVATIPDPEIVFQNLAVGNPTPGNDLQSNDFAYFGYGISQEIPYPGKLRLRAKIAQKEAEAAKAQYEADERQVAEQVRENYFNLFYLAKSRSILEHFAVELKRIAEVAKSQYEVGISPQQDLLKAELASTKILKDVALVKEEWNQLQSNLKAILGREPDSPDIPVGDVKLTPFDLDAERLRKLALSASPQMKQARALESKSEESLRLAREQFIPDLSIAYMYQKTGARFPDYYMATLGLKIPLYFWRKQAPAVQQASLENRSAKAQTNATRLSVSSQIENQWIAIRTTERIAQLYSRALIPQAEATLASAISAYRVGKVDFQSLLNAEIDLLNLREQYYRAIADHEIALAKVQQIIGSLP